MGLHLGGQLALEHRAKERRRRGAGDPDHVGDERHVEARGQRRHEIARLIRVGEHDHSGRLDAITCASAVT